MNIRVLASSLLLVSAIAVPTAHAQVVPTGNPVTCGAEFVKCVAKTGNWLICGVAYKRCIDTRDTTAVATQPQAD
ncbi:hypothetical protein [Stenotrophomonas sp. CFBP 13718]|uniref:hypothetical protein n=1 Tax=Stenotrophomonas sp. CFBP 13718 TaxID=2775304 RepID=UPI0017851F7F|nr:hypothetical protein [Stenotrophomonas sp. CFBP 13718]MBD8697459.1 hypothetical protein [Stenotrophomonas sp. CFBP 13718]